MSVTQPEFYCPKCQTHVSGKLNTEANELAPVSVNLSNTQTTVYYISCENCKDTIVGTVAVQQREFA